MNGFLKITSHIQHSLILVKNSMVYINFYICQYIAIIKSYLMSSKAWTISKLPTWVKEFNFSSKYLKYLGIYLTNNEIACLIVS